MKFEHATLDNGLQIVGEINEHARSVAAGFFVRTGSRDESDDVAGVSHFLEHMMFKGTARRTADDINREFDALGAKYNAFTSEENTVYWGAVLPEYLPPLMDLLCDMMRPALRREDFDMEKQVILEEIAMYDDQPQFKVYEACRQVHFGDHPLGNSVLGTPPSVAALTRDQMTAYFQERYAPNNMVVAVTGKCGWDDFVAMVGERCDGWPSREALRATEEASPDHATATLTRDTVTREHLCLMARAPAAQDELRYAASLLAAAVGDGDGARLYWELIEPALADAADLSYQECDGSGMYMGYVSCDQQRTGQVLDLWNQTLEKVQQEGLTEDEIRRVQNKIVTRMVLSAEQAIGRLNPVAFTWQYLHQYHSVTDQIAAFRAVTVDDIRRLLDRYPISTWNRVALGPLAEL